VDFILALESALAVPDCGKIGIVDAFLCAACRIYVGIYEEDVAAASSKLA
jgi:hypothetical protein